LQFIGAIDLLCKAASLTAGDKMNWSNEARWQIGRAQRLTIIVGCCLAMLYQALMEFHGELAPWLVIGVAAVGAVWAKVWLEPESQRPATRLSQARFKDF